MTFLIPPDQWAMLLWGFRTTIFLFIVAWIGAFILALFLVVIRSTDYRPCRWIVDVFIAYHRNVPLLVQVMFWYFAMPEVLPEGIRYWLYDHNAEFCLAAIALALGSSAYQAEDIRSGLRAIPVTQFEASRALGCSYMSTMRYVVVPQALRISTPPLVGRALLLFKNTSIAMAIGVAELTYRTREIENLTFMTFTIFGIATVLYLIGTFILMALGGWMERRATPRLKDGRHA